MRFVIWWALSAVPSGPVSNSRKSDTRLTPFNLINPLMITGSLIDTNPILVFYRNNIVRWQVIAVHGVIGDIGKQFFSIDIQKSQGSSCCVDTGQ